MIVNPQTLRGIYVGFNTLFNKALTTVTPLYTEVATVTPSTTDAETYAWLGDIPGMREWIGDREIQNLSASDYTIKNKDFELTVGIDRNAIEDDKIGLYNTSVEMLGHSAAMHPDKLVFELLKKGFTERCFDGAVFFSDEHEIGEKKVSNKGTAKLSLDAYIAARSDDEPDQQQGRAAEPHPQPPGGAAHAGEGCHGHYRGRLHQRNQKHHEGHREAPGGSPAGRERYRLVPDVYHHADQALDLPAAQEAQVRQQDQRDGRQCLHEQAVHLRRGLQRERGLRLLADGLRQRRHRRGVMSSPSTG